MLIHIPEFVDHILSIPIDVTPIVQLKRMFLALANYTPGRKYNAATCEIVRNDLLGCISPHSQEDAEEFLTVCVFAKLDTLYMSNRTNGTLQSLLHSFMIVTRGNLFQSNNCAGADDHPTQNERNYLYRISGLTADQPVQYYLAPRCETLTAGNYRVENGITYQSIRTNIVQTGNYFMVNVKRFLPLDLGANPPTFRKDTTSIHINNQLIPVPGQGTYSLQGFIIHSGNYYGGHYAYVLKQDNTTWRVFDDINNIESYTVTSVTTPESYITIDGTQFTNIMRGLNINQNCYILLYKRDTPVGVPPRITLDSIIAAELAANPAAPVPVVATRRTRKTRKHRR